MATYDEKKGSPGSSTVDGKNGTDHLEKHDGVGGYAADPSKVSASNLNAMVMKDYLRRYSVNRERLTTT